MIKKIIIPLIFVFIFLSFCNVKQKKETKFKVAYIENVYINKFSKIENGTDKLDSIGGEGEKTEKFIGVFPEKSDTVIVYKLNPDSIEDSEKFSFWSKKSDETNSIIFDCSESDEDIKITFKEQNNIIVNKDAYLVNKEYYSFLKQKILIEKSILDLAFFLKDGYSDYLQFLEPLNKNWRNQKENNKYKIIYAIIKNKNNQTDDKHFNYKIDYNYNKKGMLQSISGEESFKKEFVDENNKYFIYKIEKSINERATILQDLYLNKKTLFDSIVGSYEQYSNSKTTFFTKYQSKLKTKSVYSKPKNIQETLQLLEIN